MWVDNYLEDTFVISDESRELLIKLVLRIEHPYIFQLVLIDFQISDKRYIITFVDYRLSRCIKHEKPDQLNSIS